MSEATKKPLTELTLFAQGNRPVRFRVGAKDIKAAFALLQKAHTPKRLAGSGRPVQPFINAVAVEGGYGACKLAAERFKSGMSQAYLAKAVGMYPQHLSAMEAGKRPIGKVVAKRLAVAFGCDWQEFVRL
jgi:DNA-binding XRE family transcriptional regulator